MSGCGSSLVETKNGVTTTVTLAQGNTMSIRYLSEATVTTGQYFKVANGQGAGVPAAVQVSLSTQPADFTGPATCNKTSVAGLQPLIILGGTNCVGQPEHLLLSQRQDDISMFGRDLHVQDPGAGSFTN